MFALCDIRSAFLGLVAILAGLGFVYSVALVIYRLYLSPIARFPGSKIAAATLWTEFYYDAIKPGQFQFKIREWHATYGKPRATVSVRKYVNHSQVRLSESIHMSE